MINEYTPLIQIFLFQILHIIIFLRKAIIFSDNIIWHTFFTDSPFLQIYTTNYFLLSW